MVFITDSFFDKATIDVVKYKQKRGGNMYIVKILVEHAIYKLDTTYDYLSKYQVLAGCRVHIRFGYQQLVGYVVECQETLFTQKQLEEKNGFKIFVKEYIENTLFDVSDYEEVINSSLDYASESYHISFNQTEQEELHFNEEKNEKMRQLTVTRINAYYRDYWSNRKVNSNIVIRKYGRVIGGGGEYTPGKGMRYMKCYEYLGKLYWLYV